MILGYLRTLSEAMQARLEGLRLGLGLSLLGMLATTAGSLHRCAVYLLFWRVEDRLPSVGHRLSKRPFPRASTDVG
jgi:hypothetical protein